MRQLLLSNRPAKPHSPLPNRRAPLRAEGRTRAGSSPKEPAEKSLDDIILDFLAQEQKERQQKK